MSACRSTEHLFIGFITHRRRRLGLDHNSHGFRRSSLHLWTSAEVSLFVYSAYWKCNFRKDPHVRLLIVWLIGWLVGLSYFLKGCEVTLSCSYRSTYNLNREGNSIIGELQTIFSYLPTFSSISLNFSPFTLLHITFSKLPSFVLPRLLPTLLRQEFI